MVVHALAERDAGWWCGEATAVRRNVNDFAEIQALTVSTDIRLRFCVPLQHSPNISG